jgi:alpha-tubulin suppressor-like RCC1 family protein
MKAILSFFLLCCLAFSTQAQVSNQWLTVSAGTFFSAGIKGDGSLWVWGAVPPDQSTTISTPSQVGLDTNWMDVSCGTHHILLLKKDSTLWSMGSNEFGQLGLVNTIQTFSPQLVNSTSKWKKIQAGSHHSAAIKNDGTLWMWGVNISGQLGVGGFQNSSNPIQVQVPGICKSVALHTFHSLAIFDNGNGGKLYAWGENLYGQLGSGNTYNATVPIEVLQNNSPNSTWTTVAAGQYFSAALRSDSTLWVFGNNEGGQLGPNLAQGSYLLPVEFEPGSTWLDIKAGDSYCYGVKNDLNVYTWGNNSLGNLGTGTTLPQNTLFLLGNAINFDISAFSLSKTPSFSASFIGAHVLTLSPDHSSICSVGSNNFSQLGNGTSISRSYFDCDLSSSATDEIMSVIELSLYPNPTTGKFTIEAPFEAGQQVQVFNVNGQRVFSQPILNSGLYVSLEPNLPQGLYLLKLINEEGSQIGSSRLVVE